MNHFKKALMVACFFLSISFLLGLCFLFFISVPLEQFLSEQKLNQSLIDLFMILIIVLWSLTSFLSTVVYYLFWVRDGIKNGQVLFVTILILASSFFFSLIVRDDNSLIQTVKAHEEELSLFTIGPYPNEKALSDLKNQGYVGVISLLNPLIPFEKLLLDKELHYSKEVGLKVYSFPMLPWVSENNDTLKEISKVINANQGRYYIHCYLGRHRANLVKKYLSNGHMDQATKIIIPERFERGRTRSYGNGKVILGPYPTDEEWMGYILLSDIKATISYLDPSVPNNKKYINKELLLSKNMHFEYKNFPLKNKQPDIKTIKNIVYYSLNSDKKIYIHGFKEDAVSVLLDIYLTEAFRKKM